MKAAIHQLESFAMMLRGDQPINSRTIKLRDVLFRAVNEIDPETRKRVRLEQNSHLMRPLRGDASRLQHAIRSVLDNAIQYSREEVRIECTAEPSANALVLRVSDRGVGIPAGQEDHIFEPGYRADAAIKLRPTGMGMGLASARRTFRQHGGDLVPFHTAHPTQFDIRLPWEPQ